MGGDVKATGSWSRDFYEKYDWFPIRRDEVRPGDILANNATVTKVRVGPRRTRSPWTTLTADEVMIECGRSYWTKAKAEYAVIIGRRKAVA